MVTKVNSWLKNVWELQNERAVRNSAALEQWLEVESGGSRLRLALSFSAFVSFAVGCLANIGAFLNSVGFFSLPPGASIRPMGWMAGQCLLAMVGLLFGTLPGILGLFGKRRGFTAVGALLGFGPLLRCRGHSPLGHDRQGVSFIRMSFGADMAHTLDAAMTILFHAQRRWRRASNVQRYAD